MKRSIAGYISWPRSVAKTMVLHVLGWYGQYRALQPAACRFDPTCSSYTREAVEVHGAGKGLYYGTRRVLRCHPLGGRGYDPVPERPPARTEMRPTSHA